MSKGWYVAGYWGSRAETDAAAGDRLLALLRRLALIDPLLTSWYPVGDSRAAEGDPLATTAPAVQALIAANRIRADVPPRDVMPGMGFVVGLWNGRTDTLGVNLTIGAGTAKLAAGLTNSVVLQLPESQVAPNLFQAAAAEALVAAIVECWQPDWATFTSRQLRRSQTIEPGGYPAGWVTYARGAMAVGAELDRPITVISYEQGSVVRVDCPVDDLDAAAVSRARAALTVSR